MIPPNYLNNRTIVRLRPNCLKLSCKAGTLKVWAMLHFQKALVYTVAYCGKKWGIVVQNSTNFL